MRNLKDIIVERLILNKDKSHQQEFVDVENLTFDEFLNTFSKMSNSDIHFRYLRRSDGSKYIVSPSKNSNPTIAKYKGKKIREIYTEFSLNNGRYITIELETRPKYSISTKNINDIKDIFGIDQLEEIYTYMLNHAGN